MYFKEINGKEIKDDLFSIRDSQLEKEIIVQKESPKKSTLPNNVGDGRGTKEKTPNKTTKKSSDKNKN